MLQAPPAKTLRALEVAVRDAAVYVGNGERLACTALSMPTADLVRHACLLQVSPPHARSHSCNPFQIYITLCRLCLVSHIYV